MMSRCIVVASLCAIALSAAAPAAAQEWTLGAFTEGEFNSNFRGRPRSADTEVGFRTLTGPTLNLRDPYGRLTYDIDYRGWYSAYLEPLDSDLNDWEQRVRGEIGYAFSRRTQATVSDSFRDQSTVQFGNDDFVDGADALAGGRDQFFRNSFAVELEHTFTPRIAGTLVGTHEFIHYQDVTDRSDSASMGVVGQMLYSLNRADRIGGGASFTYQSFEPSLTGIPGQRSRLWNVFASWNHIFDDDFRFSVSGGPAFIQTDTEGTISVFNVGRDPNTGEFRLDSNCNGNAGPNPFPPPDDLPQLPPDPVGGGPLYYEDTCDTGPFVPGNFGVAQIPLIYNGQFLTQDDQSDVTFFASMSLVKDWEDWQFRVSYVRRQSNATGDGQTSTQDRILGQIEYDASRLWTFYSSVGWNRRERVGRSLGASSVIVVRPGTGLNTGFVERAASLATRRNTSTDTDQVSFVLGTRRRFSENFWGNLEFRYRYQFRDRVLTSGDSDRDRFDFFVLSFRLDYQLDTRRF